MSIFTVLKIRQYKKFILKFLLHMGFFIDLYKSFFSIYSSIYREFNTIHLFSTWWSTSIQAMHSVYLRVNNWSNHLSDKSYLNYFNFFSTLKSVAVDSPICSNRFAREFLSERVKRSGVSLNSVVNKNGWFELFRACALSGPQNLSTKLIIVDLSASVYWWGFTLS